MLLNDQHCWILLTVILLVAITDVAGVASEESDKHKSVGWTDLVGVDGKKHSLADMKSKDVVVVVFTCNRCPIAQAYDKRLVKFAADYAKRKVGVVAISVSLEKGDGPAEMKTRAKQAGYTFPFIYDPTQKAGRVFGAKSTPHVFVLNKDRKIVYQGAFDDNMFAESVKTKYVNEVVEALLAQKTVPHTKSRTVGCSISYDPTLE